MSEGVCPKCGKIASYCECEPGGKKLTVQVKTDDALREAIEENALLKQKIKDSEEITASLALDAFENEKEALKREFSDKGDAIDMAGTPQQLEELKSKLQMNKRAPAGKATNPGFGSGGSSESFESKAEMVDELYKRAYYEPSKYDKATVEDARNKISELHKSMISSPSWRELRGRGKLGKILEHEVETCSKCGATKVDERKCPRCGYDPYEKQPVEERRLYKGPEKRGEQ